MKPQDRIVYRNQNGDYVNKRLDATKASSVHRTQQQATAAAHRMLQNQGGGELSIQAVRGEGKGQIRSKDTVAPGNDPRSIRDTEH